MKNLLSLFLVVALTACGGGSQSPILIELYGDSTNVGIDGDRCSFGGQNCSGIPTIPPLAYVSLPGYTIHNKSVGGLGAAELVLGKPSANVLPFSDQMLTSPASVVIIALGINDSSTSTPTAYAASLQALIDLARPRRIIMMTENPTYLPGSATFAQVARDVAVTNHLKIIDLNTYLLGVIGAGSLLAYITDGIHQNTSTYKLSGEFMNAQLPIALQ